MLVRTVRCGSIIEKKIENNLNSLPYIHFATIFGSYAKNCNHPGSDLDIAIAADKPMSYQEMTRIKNS